MSKKNVIRIFSLFALLVTLALAGLALVKTHFYSAVFSSPSLGASSEAGKDKIYKIKVKKNEENKKGEIMGFSAETAKTLGIELNPDFERDLDSEPAGKEMDDYTELMKSLKKPKQAPKSDVDMNAVMIELERIKAAEAKAAQAEAAAAKKQRERDNKELLKERERGKKLEARHKKDINKDLNKKFDIDEVDYGYEGLTE